MKLLSSFRFLHAADIHLDSPLRGLARYEGVPVDEIRLATRAALKNLVAAAIELEVAFVVIAGDLYDGDWPDFSTGLFFCSMMGQLERAGIEAFVLFGNHDAESILTRTLPMPGNVRLFDTRKCQTLRHDGTGAALHGWSYRVADTRDNLVKGYPPPVPNALNIGVLHTALTGRPPHAPYAPCTVPELVAKGYDYWALGHVHDFAVHARDPYVVHSGNLQGRSIRETGPKGCVLLQVIDGRISDDLRFLPLDAARWAAVTIDASTVETEGGLTLAARRELTERFANDADGRPLIVRFTVAGATDLHGDLARRGEHFRQDIRAIATGISDRLWIEKVVVQTTEVAGAAPVSAAQEEIASLLGEGLDDEALKATLTEELADFIGRIPPELGEGGLLAAAHAGDLSDLLKGAADVLAARLTKAEA